MSAQPRELRVLDGLHAGARAPLSLGLSTRLSIGSALDNDIVLSDPGIAANHAELVWNDASDRWQLHRDGGARPTEHGLGEAVMLGPVRLTVAAANEPFDAVVVVPEAGPEAGPEMMPEPEPDPEPATGSESAPPAQTVAPTAPRRSLAMRVVIVLVSLLLLLLAGGVAALFWLAPPPVPIVAAAVATPAASALAAVQHVVDAQGLSGRVQVVVGSGGLPRVEGLVDDEALIESLASALSRLQPRPAMRVWSPATLRTALREAGVVLPAGLSLRISPQGAAVLAGPIAGPEAARVLKAQLQALLPASVTWVDELLRPPQLAERFIADARAQGFVLSGRLQSAQSEHGDQLHVSGRITAADVPRWERWLLEASRRHAGALRFVVALEPEATREPMSARSPLQIRSVLGGAEPMLVLADGSRLLVGGRHEGWRLVAIDDRSIAFEGHGRSLTVPR